MDELIAVIRACVMELTVIADELKAYREDCRRRDQKFHDDVLTRTMNIGQDANRKFEMGRWKRRRGDETYGPPDKVVNVKNDNDP